MLTENVPTQEELCARGTAQLYYKKGFHLFSCPFPFRDCIMVLLVMELR